MKKFSIIALMGVAAWAMASCDDYELPNPPAQSNPEEPVFETDGLKLTNIVEGTVDLRALQSEGKSVGLFTFELTDFPSTSKLTVVAELSGSDNFSGAATVPTEISGDSVCMSVSELNAAFREKISKGVDARSVYVRYAAYATNGSESVRLGGPDYYYASQEYSVLPLLPERLLDSKYYFAWSTDGSTWSTENAVEFAHSETNVYDDPKFSVTLNFDAATVGSGMFWKIIPGSTFDSGSFDGLTIGVSPENENIDKGALVEGEDTEAGIYTVVGPSLFNFNIEALTFDYMVAIPNFWMAGDYVNGTSWNDGKFAKVMWTDNYTDYVGLAHIGSQFKFSPVDGWSGDFGVGEAVEYVTGENGITVGTGVADGGSNISVPANALYYIELNYATRALKLTQINTIGIIGGFNGWGNSNEMTPSDDLLTWTITQDMTEGDEWKIRMNNDWTISLGGEVDNLWPFNGSNFKCTETGTYEITLNLGTLPWTATVVKK